MNARHCIRLTSSQFNPGTPSVFIKQRTFLSCVTQLAPLQMEWGLILIGQITQRCCSRLCWQSGGNISQTECWMNSCSLPFSLSRNASRQLCRLWDQGVTWCDFEAHTLHSTMFCYLECGSSQVKSSTVVLMSSTHFSMGKPFPRCRVPMNTIIPLFWC
jgi:hypothetical protein